MNCFLVRQFLEKMGQIAFFRAGNEPIVLNEQQRNSRKEGIIALLNDYLIHFNVSNGNQQLASNK